jgi:hypothetical protein
MKNKLKIILGGALLLVTSIAVAGIIFVPVGGRYANPELAPVDIQNVGEGMVRIRTTGLTGELSLDASDVPPEFEVPVPGCARLSFDQNLQLVINLSLGMVEGRSRGRISTQDGLLEYRTEVRGNATCRPFNGRSCGQIIVDLELRGTLSDPADPSRVGLLRMETLGSLLRDQGNASWAQLTSNARLGGDAALIGSIISMSEGESCGV